MTEIIELSALINYRSSKNVGDYLPVRKCFHFRSKLFCENCSDSHCFWLFSGKNYKESCFKEVFEYHKMNLNESLTPMIETYRKAIGSKVWHFCTNCATYPTQDYTSFPFPQRVVDAELCTECIARHAIGDCAGDRDVGSLTKRKCSVIVDSEECGLDLVYDLASALHICPSGHSTLIVPPAKPRK